MLLTDGGFDDEGRIVRVEPAPEDVLEDLFRHRVFRFLLDADAVTEGVVEGMLEWQRSGFGVPVSRSLLCRGW